MKKRSIIIASGPPLMAMALWLGLAPPALAQQEATDLTASDTQAAPTPGTDLTAAPAAETSETPAAAEGETLADQASTEQAAVPGAEPAPASAPAPAEAATGPAPVAETTPTAEASPTNDAAVQVVNEKSPPESELKKMSPAEQAIVQNAAVLDTMTPPVPGNTTVKGQGMRVTDILSQPADIRPLPHEYLIVKKDKSAGDKDARLSAARMALAEGNDTAAFELFDELFRENPVDNRVALGRAVALQRMGQTQDALVAYESALTHNPDNIEALTNMMGLLKDNPDVAIAKLTALREAYPAHADIAAQLGMVYGAAGDYDNAIKYLNMADAISPGNSTVLFNKAVAYDRMGRAEQAAILYRKVLTMSAQEGFDASLPVDAVKKRLAVLR